MTLIIYLPDYEWLIKIFYITPKTNIDKILKELDDIDCEAECYFSAANMLEDLLLDSGLTYTDIDKHITFILIGEGSCPKEFMHTYIHEIGHASSHIAELFDIDLRSEEYQYLQGDIALQMFDKAKHFLCEHCRKEKGEH